MTYASRFKSITIILLILASSASAFESTFDGFMRAGYIVQEQAGAFQDDAAGVSGKIGAEAEVFRHMEFNFGLYTSERITPAGATAVTADFFDINNQSYAFVGEASIKGEYQYHSFNFGRQVIDTAHADSDDIRMVKDLYNAYAYRYEGFCNTKLELIHFTQMAGWENGSDPKTFVSMYDVLGITDANGAAINKGVTMAHLGYDDAKFTFDIYDYHLYDAYDAVYLELGYIKDFSEAFSLGLGLQYDANFGSTPFTVGGTLMNGIDAQVAGAQLLFGFGKLGTELGFAANLGIGRDAIMGSWGGGSYFTSIESSTFDAIGDPSGLAYLASVAQELFIDGLSISYAYGVFHGSNIAINHFTEQNVALSYEIENKVKWVVTYATVEDHVSAANNFRFLYSFLELPFIY